MYPGGRPPNQSELQVSELRKTIVVRNNTHSNPAKSYTMEYNSLDKSLLSHLADLQKIKQKRVS